MWLQSKPKSLQRKVMGFILVISFILLALSVSMVYMAINNFAESQALRQTVKNSLELSHAIRDFAFERGRMHVVLLSASPISMGDRNFISSRRQTADASLLLALKKLEATHPAIAVDLAMRFETLKDLRRQVDAEAEKPLGERKDGIAQFWLFQSSNFIFQVENSLHYLGQEQIENGRFFQYHQLVSDSLQFRLLAGYHATILTGVFSKVDSYSRWRDEDLASFKLQADSLWSRIEMQVANLSNLEIMKAKLLVNIHYYNEYRPEQERLLSLAQEKSVDSNLVTHLQTLSVPAFDAIFLLIDAAEGQMQEYVNDMQIKAKWLFVFGISQLAACLLLVAFCVWYFERRVFGPIQRIIHALERLGNNEDIAIKNTDVERKDEIGQISRGVQRLRASIDGERRLLAENEQLAMTDFLTGCLNKRGFYLRAEAELNQAAREGTSISFMFADLDNLKRLNDSYGHLIGDEAVRHFVTCVAAQCRPYDLVGRFGGDEFVFCFPQTAEEQALKIVERIQTALEKSPFRVSEHRDLQLRASFGLISGFAGADRDVEWFVHQADMALYKAKQSGKNCVMLGSDKDSDRTC